MLIDRYLGLSALVVPIAIATSLPTSGRAPEYAKKEISKIGSQVVKLAGNQYRFPKYAIVRYFGKPDPYSVEVNLRKPFWEVIFNKVAPSPGWMTFDSGVPGLHSITKPGDLYQWRFDRPPPLPPVRGPVEPLATGDGMRLWKSLDPEIAVVGHVYVTFDGRSDLYAECTEMDVKRSDKWCQVWVFDRGVIHSLGVAGTWLKHAPAAADEYLRTVRVD